MRVRLNNDFVRTVRRNLERIPANLLFSIRKNTTDLYSTNDLTGGSLKSCDPFLFRARHLTTAVQHRLRRRAHAGSEPKLLDAVADAGAEALHAGEQGKNRGLLRPALSDRKVSEKRVMRDYCAAVASACRARVAKMSSLAACSLGGGGKKGREDLYLPVLRSTHVHPDMFVPKKTTSYTEGERKSCSLECFWNDSKHDTEWSEFPF